MDRRVHVRGALLVLVLLLAPSAGCESTLMQTLRGARDYSAGSKALERGDSARAVVLLSQAAALVPRASEIQNHLGLAYWADGDRDRARIAFDRAIELDCDNAAARRNRRLLEEGASDGG